MHIMSYKSNLSETEKPVVFFFTMIMMGIIFEDPQFKKLAVNVF